MDEIEIVASRPEWSTLFDQEAERLRALLPAAAIVGLHHIGSTAIPASPQNR